MIINRQSLNRCSTTAILFGTAWLAYNLSAADVEHSNLIQILRAFQGQTNDLPSAPTEGTPQAPATSRELVIVPGDVFELIVVDDELLSLSTAKVEDDGTIHHPVIGRLLVRGQTIAEARAGIERLVAADYLVSPQVYLRQIRQGTAQFMVQGRVSKPGNYPCERGKSLTLAQAIERAGGLAGSEPVQVTIERWAPGSTNLNRITVSYSPPESLAPEPILPGDLIWLSSLPSEGIVAPVP